MLKVGITGSIGSGKTTVCEIFEALGIPVYNADRAARDLMETDPALRSAITARFGSSIYSGARLNRKILADKVFIDKQALADLNAMVHPAVQTDSAAWMSIQQAPYIIKEAALLFETGSYKQLDKIICVVAAEKTRIKRVMDRDGVSRDQVLARMANQWSQDKKMEMADYILQNDDQDLLLPQVVQLHSKLSELAATGADDEQ